LQQPVKARQKLTLHNTVNIAERWEQTPS